ncbi:MAG: hypothetical protein E7290_12920 [Lachnospiraceae bacterium]|nr:hypothetical protein [Lachnospiraceae bacterium]
MEYTQKSSSGSTFSSVALVFAIASLLTVMTVYLPLLLGSLALIFAVLGRGERLKFNMTEWLTIGLSTFSIIIVLIAMVAALYILFMEPQLILDSIEMMAPMLEEIYGVTAEELIQQLESTFPFFN